MDPDFDKKLEIDEAKKLEMNEAKKLEMNEAKKLEINKDIHLYMNVDRRLEKQKVKDRSISIAEPGSVVQNTDHGTRFFLLCFGFVLLLTLMTGCRTGTSTQLKTGSSAAGSKQKSRTFSAKVSSQDRTKDPTEEPSQNSTEYVGASRERADRAKWSEDLSDSAQSMESTTGKDSKMDFSKPKDKKLARLQDQFLTRLKTAVKKKNKKELFSLLDPAYIKTQLKGLLRGRVDRFLNELFCGSDSAGKFHCLKWQQIQKVVEIRVGWIGNTAKAMQMVVTNGKITVTVDYSLVPIPSSTTFPYRFRGGVG